MSAVPTWYDLLDVEPTASTDEIRAAWKAAVADLEEPLPPPDADCYACACTPPAGLRELLGIADLDDLDDRLAETALLIRLRRALSEVEGYAAALDVVADEAAQILAYRLGAPA